MKLKYLFLASMAIIAITACGSKQKANAQEEPQVETTENVATEEEVVVDGNPSRASYIIISKETMTLKLYDTSDRVIFNFPVAVGKNYGNKRKPGDMKTPEGEFTIQQIQNASSWSHDFKDGKGVIPHAYGDWFIRLRTPPHSGIGIHGTHAPNSIGTRATEGCIRLHNDNLNKLKPLLKVGMKVTILTSQRDTNADKGIVENTPQPQSNPIKKKEPEVKTAPVGGNEAVATTGGIVEHTIESGQLLGHISVMYHTTVDKILELNPGLDPRRIRAGQTIKIQPNTDAQSAKPTVEEDPNGVYHTIEKGQLLGHLAELYETSVSNILDLNPGIDPSRIQIGQRVRVK